MHRKGQKHGRSSYLSVGTGSDSQSLLEAEPLRSKDRGLFTYNIDIYIIKILSVCLSSIGGQTAGPIMTKFGMHMRIDLGMVST